MSWPMPNQAPWTAGIAGMPPNNMNMGSYTPEQWAAMQQQNWQQWTQWQQQYTQWQNQYGAKYSQMQGTFPMNNVPPPPSGGPAPPVPPPPDQPPPPPPPHENNQPLYGNNLPGSQPPQRTNYSNTIPTTGNTQWPTNTDTTTNQSQPSVNSEALKKLAEEERLFDIQFKKWEEEIDKWRKENVNHPDKQAYKEYEQRFEQCRTQLLERREQMKKNRDKLMGTPSQPVPVTAPSQNANPVYKQQPQTQSQNNSQYQNFDSSYGNSNNKNIDPQDRYESYPNESFMENFNDSSNNSFLTTSSSTKGIPGLDLVPELSKNIKDVVDITDDEKSKQAPDYSTISKGIKNILGDEKIMNILSMVRKDVGSTLEQNAQFQGNQNYQNAPPIQDNQNFGRQNAPYNRQGPNQPQYGQGDSQYSAQQDQYYDANTQHGGPNNFGNQNRGILGPRPDGSLLGPGNSDLRQGGPNRPMGPHSGPNVRPSGPQGVSNVRPGGPQGGNNMRPGGPPGGHNMRPGGPQGGPNVRSGAPNIRQNGPNGPRHGGPNQNMQHGGSNQHMQQGGPNQNNMQHSGPNQHMQQGGPNQHMQQSGPNQHMQQGVSNQHKPQGGPNHRMTQGGPNIRPGAQNMRHPGPIMRPPGPNMRPSGPGPQGLYNNGPRPLMQTPVHRPPLEDLSSQQNTNNYYGEQEMPPENVAPVVSQPSRPKWDHEPMFNPSIVVEYEHKPLRLKARDFIEPVHTFDYNHTSKDGDTKRKDFEKEVEELFARKPKRVTDRDDEDRYSKDLFYRDDRRSGRDREREREYRDRPRDENREEHWRERPREEHIDRRKDLRYDDRRREDFDRHRDDKDRRERDDFRDRRREEDYSRRDRDEPNYLRDRNRDFRRDDNRNRSRSRDRDSRKRGVSRESEISNSSAKKSKEAPMLQDKKHVVMIDDLLELPGREMRPEKIVLILRGPPGSGKTYLAKLIRDREAELGGTVRIMSIDDYFMQEGEIEEKDPVTGKIVKKPTLKYEYDAALEDTYITSLKRAFKRSITDGYFSFLIYDAMNDQLKSYADIWNYARQNGFQVYVCTMDLDPQLCHKRNIHNRSLEDIEIISSRFFPTPLHHIQLDPTTLLQNAAITDVQMEDVENEPILDEPEVESVFTSKWEKMDDATQLARLDGTSKPLRPSQYSMEDYLQLDEWTPNKAKPGKKSVRWADIEERREQEKMRAIGFVVGQTDWNRMTDPTMGSSALTQTKYIERVRRNQ